MTQLELLKAIGQPEDAAAGRLDGRRNHAIRSALFDEREETKTRRLRRGRRGTALMETAALRHDVGGDIRPRRSDAHGEGPVVGL